MQTDKATGGGSRQSTIAEASPQWFSSDSYGHRMHCRAGIFVLTGTAAAEHAGPALAISFVISGLGCLCAGLCYGEFASMIPLSGSAYSYAYATLGELLAWVLGWDLILEYMVGAATVASGWSGYAVKLLDHLRINIPAGLSHAPFSFEGEHFAATGAFLNVPAVFIIILITCLLVVGIRESTLVNSIIVAVKLSVITAFIIFCFPHVKASNWTPFIPPNTGQIGSYGWTGIIAAAGVMPTLGLMLFLALPRKSSSRAVIYRSAYWDLY